MTYEDNFLCFYKVLSSNQLDSWEEINPPKIKYIEMPENIKHQYQYYTRANMKKVIDKGYKIKALTLEEGVYDYVTNYLLSNDKYK